MDDKKVIKRLYESSKSQLIPVIFLILFNIVLAVVSVGFAVAAKLVIDSAVARDMNSFISNAIILFAVIISQLVLRLICRSMEIKIQAKLEMKYKTDLFNSILKKDYGKITKYHSGDLMTRLTSDVNVISEGITTIVPNVVSMATRLACSFGVMIVLSREFALVFLAGGSLIFILTRLLRSKLKSLHKEIQQTDGDVRSFMQEALESLLVVKVFGAKRYIENKSDKLQDENFRAKMKRKTLSVTANSGFSFVFQLGRMYAILWSCLNLFYGKITVGTLTAVLQLVNQIQLPITNLSGIVPKIYSVLASAERILEIEQIDDEAVYNDEKIADGLYDRLTSIDFKNISFSYDRDEILKDANLSICKNDFVLISGISGIGKSTLMKMTLGCITPDEGEIQIVCDTESYRADKITRSLFSYVPQGNMMLSGTLRESVTLMNPDATEKEIKEALKIACADEFTDSLPLGLDTVIGEKGIGFSEGQIQRLAIARAIISGAPILLLDESTSALDEQTELKLLKNIQELKTKTCILISHKKAAFDVCNKIVVIEDKKINTKENSN